MSSSVQENGQEEAARNSTSPEEKVHYELAGKGNGELGEVEENGLRRNLKARHMQMIAIGGTIGTGLFVGSGASLQAAGPAGNLIAFTLVGTMVFFIMQSLGEMATLIPQSGSFTDYAGRFVDPALGFALGWNYWLSWSLAVPVELTASEIVLSYWPNGAKVPSALWIILFLIVLILLNCLGSKGYGESEYWFAIIKVFAVLGFLIFGIIIASGGVTGNTLGFTYWKNPGAFAAGVPGVITAFINAGFSFSGTEVVGVTAGESANPEKNVPKAIRNVFWRILFFYISTIFIIGLCVPYTNENLVGGYDPSASPFTIVFQSAGVSVGASIINAVILITVLSAGNSGLYAASRTLMALARNNHAPQIFARVNRLGVPIYALLFSSLLSFLALLNLGDTSAQVFTWLLNVTAVEGFFTWGTISLTHWRFRLAYRKQGYKESDLIFKAWFFPFGPLIGLVTCTFIILANGYTAFWTPTGGAHFDFTAFLTAYINIPIFFLFYFVWKFYKRTSIVPLATMDLITGRKQRTKPTEINIDLSGKETNQGAISKARRILRRMISWIS